MPLKLRQLIGLASVVLVVTLGCGGRNDPHGRLAVAGTVALRGTLVEVGTIEFLPTGPGMTLSTRTLIRNGKFQVASEQGIPPGTYRVLITSPEANDTEAPVGPPGHKMPPLGKERIPAAYNRDSKLTVEVTAEGDNTFHFALD